jgi:hypothetical protein
MNWYQKAHGYCDQSAEVVNSVVVINDSISETHSTKPSDILLYHVGHLIPEGWNVSCSHFILHDGPIREREEVGKEVVITASQMGIDGQTLALKAEVTDESGDIIKNGHIIVAVNKMEEKITIPEKWSHLKEVMSDSGKSMSQFSVVGYVCEMTIDNKVIFND